MVDFHWRGFGYWRWSSSGRGLWHRNCWRIWGPRSSRLRITPWAAIPRRPVPPYALPDNDSYYFQSFNRNKKSLALRIRTPEGKAILRRLVSKADALYANCRGDAPRETRAHLQALEPLQREDRVLFSLRLRDDGPQSARARLRLPHAGVRRHHGPDGESPTAPPPRRA